MKILFGTSNIHKINELKSIINDKNIEIISLNELDKCGEPIENGTSFKENAEIKARYYFEKYHIPTLADDSGIIAKALNNLPGIYSARFNELYKDFSCLDNTELLLRLLEDNLNRDAYFICDLAYFDGINIHHFTGLVNGTLTKEKRGINGFGYDPIFIPNGFQMTFAEMSDELKNTLSHRKIALDKFVSFLKNN